MFNKYFLYLFTYILHGKLSLILFQSCSGISIVFEFDYRVSGISQSPNRRIYLAKNLENLENKKIKIRIILKLFRKTVFCFIVFYINIFETSRFWNWIIVCCWSLVDFTMKPAVY